MYYIFLVIDDLSGPVNLRIYYNRPDVKSDLYLIHDIRLLFLDNFITVKTFSYDSINEVLKLITFYVLNDGVSVIDFTGVFFQKGVLNFYNDLCDKLEEMEVKLVEN